MSKKDLNEKREDTIIELIETNELVKKFNMNPETIYYANPELFNFISMTRQGNLISKLSNSGLFKSDGADITSEIHKIIENQLTLHILEAIEFDKIENGIKWHYAESLKDEENFDAKLFEKITVGYINSARKNFIENILTNSYDLDIPELVVLYRTSITVAVEGACEVILDISKDVTNIIAEKINAKKNVGMESVHRILESGDNFSVNSLLKAIRNNME